MGLMTTGCPSCPPKVVLYGRAWKCARCGRTGKKTTRYRCRHCGKLTAGRLPRAHGRFYGDGTIRYPRRHQHEGKPCPGNIQEAEWVDVVTSD